MKYAPLSIFPSIPCCPAVELEGRGNSIMYRSRNILTNRSNVAGSAAASFILIANPPDSRHTELNGFSTPEDPPPPSRSPPPPEPYFPHPLIAPSALPRPHTPPPPL